MMNSKLFKKFSIGTITLWLTLFALIPFVLVIVVSFLKQGANSFFVWHFTLQNYISAFHLVYFHIFIRSFYLAAITAFLCLVMGYPFAFIVSKVPEKFRAILMFLLIMPFWTSSLMRIYALIIIIRVNGLLNHFLMWLGVIHSPFHILYTQLAVLIGLVYALLPFMVLPLYANLEKFDWRLIDAAKDLGAGKLRIFFKILIPLTMPGIIAGVMLVLLPAVTMFYIPDILGGARSLLIGNLIKTQFIQARNWPMGAAVSVLLTVIMAFMLLIYWKSAQSDNKYELL